MTSTVVPAVPAGTLAVILVAESTVKLVAFLVPNLTAVAPSRLVPVMTTLLPPTAGPPAGLMAVTVGCP